MCLKSIRSVFLAVTIIIISSCGKSTEKEVADAILSANILLSTGQCQPAIDLLEAVGNQPKNAKYLKVLSTAYACRAGYSSTVFFGTDIAKTAMPSPLGGVTLYTTSTVTSTSPLANDTKYKDLLNAINILLYAGGSASTVESGALERAKYFNVNEQSDINTQLAFMMLVQLGKFMKVYADTDATGAKGGGSAGNNCFTNYSTTPALVQTYVTAVLPGACDSVSSSHPELEVGATNRKARLCQGVVLMNNILDILPAILASAAGGSLSDISSVTTLINTQKTELTTRYPAIGATATVLSQANCETEAAITEDTLAAYYAVIFEGLIQ